MFCQFFNFKFRRVVSTLLMSVVMLLSFIPSAFAVPGTSNDVPGNVSNLGWIDLSATVPEGFNGSVFVVVRNIADNSYHDVECFIVNDFKNSKQVPVGNYEVIAATTSEDPLFYNVFCDIEEFALTGSYSLHVVVEEISDSDKLMVESLENQEVGSEVDSPNQFFYNEQNYGTTNGVTTNGVNNASNDKVSQNLKGVNSTKSPYSLLISLALSIVLLFVAGFVLWKFKNR